MFNWSRYCVFSRDYRYYSTFQQSTQLNTWNYNFQTKLLMFITIIQILFQLKLELTIYTLNSFWFEIKESFLSLAIADHNITKLINILSPSYSPITHHTANM